MRARTKLNDDIWPSPSVRKFPIDGGLLLLDVSSNCLFVYNDTARYAWELIEAGQAVEDFEAQFARSWDIPLSRAQADLRLIVAQWRMQGLLAGSKHPSAFVEPEMNVAGQAPRAEPMRWAAEWICTIRDVTIAFAIENAVPATVRLFLNHLETPGLPAQTRIEVRGEPDRNAIIFRDGLERVRSVDPAEFVGGLWQTILGCIYPDVRWRAFIHGAALARDGVGLALVGPSGSGKTTLAAGLVSRGFDYFADDMVALSEPDGEIAPWPLPLSIKPGGLEPLRSRYPELEQASTYPTKGVQARLLLPAADSWNAKPVRLQALILPRFSEDAAPQQLRLSSFQALQCLLTDRIWLGHPLTEATVKSFLAWLDATPAFAISYGTLDDAVQFVERVIA